MSEEQKKQLEAIRKKKGHEKQKTKTPDQNALVLAQQLLQQTGSGNLLSFTATGKANRAPKMNTVARVGTFDKSNSQCFACQQFGHWHEDESCPAKIKRTQENKGPGGH